MSEATNAGTKSEGSSKVAAFIRREIGRVTALASLLVIFTFFFVDFLPTAFSIALMTGIASITMPGPPPYGLSSTLLSA